MIITSRVCGRGNVFAVCVCMCVCVSVCVELVKSCALENQAQLSEMPNYPGAELSGALFTQGITMQLQYRLEILVWRIPTNINVVIQHELKYSQLPLIRSSLKNKKGWLNQRTNVYY